MKKNNKYFNIKDLMNPDECLIYVVKENIYTPDKIIMERAYDWEINGIEYYAIPFRTFADAIRMEKLVWCKLVKKEDWNENCNSRNGNEENN